MLGSHTIKVSRRRSVSFEFTLKRNITIVRGDSGTGKTTLFEMIDDHARLGDKSGVSIQSDCPCIALSDKDWKHQLESTTGSIVFVDEGFREIVTEDFASMVRGSDNYFVLITRTDLPNLPYSVEEIYQIKTSGKFHTFEPMYKHDEAHRFYINSSAKPRKNFDTLLTEDSKSGLQFFDVRLGKKLSCESAEGNAKVLSWLLEHPGGRVFVIADGAAFGAHADRVLKLQSEHRDRIAVCLPESFEWLLLRSGVTPSNELSKVLDDPSAHIDSQQYESWEQYFTELLVTSTAGTPFEYKKSKLADAYLIPKNADRVMALIACKNVK